jgi:hypothetical protein
MYFLGAREIKIEKCLVLEKFTAWWEIQTYKYPSHWQEQTILE